MPITPSAPPPAAGTIEPGNLYVDMPNRILWLGVDLAEDPSGAALICDLDGVDAAIVAALASSTAYTDSQVATRAPLVHTHTSSQVTDFTAAVQAVVGAMPGTTFVAGMIMLWSGLLSEIGVGDLAGWALCDGSNGTPDLRDRFIIGAGNKAPGDEPVATSLSTSTDGSHSHTVSGTALTVDQLPAHTHALSSGGGSATGTTGSAGTHSHPTYVSSLVEGSAGSDLEGGIMLREEGSAVYPAHTSSTPDADAGDQIGTAGAHTHSATLAVTLTGNTGNAGAGLSHTHTTSPTGTHNHTVTANQLRDTIPYYALAYIMKL